MTEFRAKKFNSRSESVINLEKCKTVLTERRLTIHYKRPITPPLFSGNFRYCNCILKSIKRRQSYFFWRILLVCQRSLLRRYGPSADFYLLHAALITKVCRRLMISSPFTWTTFCCVYKLKYAGSAQCSLVQYIHTLLQYPMINCLKCKLYNVAS